MNIKLRKQFSKGYQVFEIELDNVPQYKIDDANKWMDEMGLKEVNSMAAIVGDTGTNKPTYTPKPQYNKTYNNTQKGNYSGGTKAATPKQIEWLQKYNVEFDPATITSAEASKLLDGVFSNDRKKDNTITQQSRVASEPAEENPYEAMGNVVSSDGLPF